MESNDIIKALEDWIKNYDGSYVNFKILGNALDLITQQQAENENLKVENQSLRSAANSLKMHYEETQAEVERLRKEVNLVSIQFQDLQERYEEAQAEIESLKIFRGYAEKRASDYRTMRDKYLNAKSEAYKECLAKVKNYIKTHCNPYGKPDFDYDTSIKMLNFIDKLAKEMTGE